MTAGDPVCRGSFGRVSTSAQANLFCHLGFLEGCCLSLKVFRRSCPEPIAMGHPNINRFLPTRVRTIFPLKGVVVLRVPGVQAYQQISNRHVTWTRLTPISSAMRYHSGVLIHALHWMLSHPLPHVVSKIRGAQSPSQVLPINNISEVKKLCEEEQC